MDDKDGVGETKPPSDHSQGGDWKEEDAIFSCRLCDSRFSSASLLSWHYHQCHTDKPERSDPRQDGQYPCVYCWQKFESYRGLIGHISSAHASVWYHSLAAASRLDDYNYMRQFADVNRSPTLPTSLAVTSPLTRPPVMTSPIITPPDVKLNLLPDFGNPGSQVMYSSGSESESKYRVTTPGSLAPSPVPSTSKDNRVQHDSTKIMINGREQYLCKFCDSIFHSSNEVDDHVASVHGSTSRDRSGGKYECQYCPDAFPLYTALQEHIRCYHGDEYYRRRGRKDATPPNTPVSGKHPTPRPSPDQPHVFKCQLCVSGFTENSLLADHYRKVHGVPTSPAIPTIKTEPKLPTTPVMEHKPVIPEQDQSSKPDPRSVGESSMSVPKSERSPTEESAPTQDERSSGDGHVSNVGEAIELKYICEVCDARFPLYVSMQEHIRTAHGERPFECDVCRKQFTKRCYLLKHLQSHPNTHYDCLHCGRRFSSWTQRRDHMMQHEVEGVFLCTHCGSRFTLQRHLEQHLRTHADASHVLVCVDCNHKFDDSMEFQEHVRSHVRCPYCSQVFDTNKNLVDHIETTHQKAKLQAKFSHEVKKPQKIVAPVPKSKAQSPSKTIRTDTTSSSTSTSSANTAATSALSTAVTTTSSSANPFGGGIAPMYVWMPGSHFPAAVFPTLSIVSPQLTAMQAVGDPHIQEQRNLPQTLLNTQLQPAGNLFPGYPAYALPYPYQSHPLLVPAVDGAQQTTSENKRRRTPETEPQGRKPKLAKSSSSVSEDDTRPRMGSSSAESDPRQFRTSLSESERQYGASGGSDTRQRYGTLLDRLSVPTSRPPSLASHTEAVAQLDASLDDQTDAKASTAERRDQFVCKLCAEILPTAELLARHEAEHNDDSPLNLSCKPESKTSQNPTDQNPIREKTEHSRENPEMAKTSDQHCEITPVGSDFFRCEMCMSIISNLHLVEKHLNEHFMVQPVDEDKVTFSCGKCRLSFRQRSEFFYHLLKNHTDDNYFQCNICKKKFITERFLDKHMNVHLLAQNFTCQFCNKGFYLADVCNRHERLHWQCGDKPKVARKREEDQEVLEGAQPADPPGETAHTHQAPPTHDAGDLSAAPDGLQPPSALNIPSSLTPVQKQHVYVMYKCQTCQMEFSHKRQIKHHLSNSACALDDRTSSKHYTKFHKCKLCHVAFDHPDKVIHHYLIRHQMDIGTSDSGPKSDNSTSSGSTAASDCGLDTDGAFEKLGQSSETCVERERSPSELKWALIRGKSILPPVGSEPPMRLGLDPPLDRSPSVCPTCGREFLSSQQLNEHDCSLMTDNQ